MTKVVIHLEDKYSITDFDGLKHKILISLTVNSPILVSLLSKITLTHAYMFVDPYSVQN